MNVDFSAIGWVHAIASIVAVLLRAMTLVARKGTTRHKNLGKWYFYSMIATNLTALGIYRLGSFRIFHWLAVVTLLIVIVGFLAASRQAAKHWTYIHLTCMVISYYLLIGGAVNEAFLRIDPLHKLAATSPSIFGMTHFCVQLMFAAVLVYFLTKVARQKIGVFARAPM